MAHPGGRPPFEITEEVIKQAEFHASRGLTLEQIARSLGIAYYTLHKKTQKFGELDDAIKRGQAKGIATIANALFNAAKNGNITAQIFYLKCRAHWREVEIETALDDSVKKAREDVAKLKEEQHARLATATA